MQNATSPPRTLQRKTTSTQQGFVLISLMVALAVLSIILATYYWREAQHQKMVEAQVLGNQLAQYVSSVESRLSNDMNIKAGTYRDLSFLKSTSCPSPNKGTADDDYLPCSFSFVRFSRSLLAHNPVTKVDIVTPAKRTATITIQQITVNDGNKLVISPLLGAMVVQAAQAHLGTNQHAVYNGSALYHYDKNKAQITIDLSVVGTNGTWLRIDGKNKMEANIGFDATKPANQREIQGVSAIEGVSNDNVTIKSFKQLNEVAANIMSQADSVNQVTGKREVYLASGNSKLTLEPSKVSLSGSTFNDSATTSDIESTTTTINRNKGTVYLGNQSGVKGNSNVVVNDLTIHSMNNQKLTSLLGGVGIPYAKENPSKTYSFSVKTGNKGYAYIHVYGGCNIDWGQGGVNFYFTHNGSRLIYRKELGEQIKGYGAAVTFTADYLYKGDSNALINGFKLQMENYAARCEQPYIGYSYIPI